MGALGADGSGVTVAWTNEHIVGQDEQFLANRSDNLRVRTTPQIGASNAALEERVASEETSIVVGMIVRVRACPQFGAGCARCIIVAHTRSNGCVLLNHQAYAAGGMTGSMKHLRREAAPANGVTLLHEVFDASDFRRGDAKPLCLDLEMAVEIQIRLVDQDRRARGALEPGKAAHVVNVCVRAYNCADLELMPAQKIQDALHFISWIHDNRFARGSVAQYRTIALQQPDRNHFMDEFPRHRDLV